MDVSAAGHATALDYSNQTVCALEGGVPALAVDDRTRRSLAARDAVATKTGSAFPIAMTLILSAAAFTARKVLIP